MRAGAMRSLQTFMLPMVGWLCSERCRCQAAEQHLAAAAGKADKSVVSFSKHPCAGREPGGDRYHVIRSPGTPMVMEPVFFSPVRTPPRARLISCSAQCQRNANPSAATALFNTNAQIR